MPADRRLPGAGRRGGSRNGSSVMWPVDADELSDAVTTAVRDGLRVRIVEARPGRRELVPGSLPARPGGPELVICPGRLSHLLHVDRGAGFATFGAGATVAGIGRTLAAWGLEPAGWADRGGRSLGATLSLAPPAPTPDVPGLAAVVSAVEVVDPGGGRVQLSAGAPGDAWAGVASGLGAFGVPVAVTLACGPATHQRIVDDVVALRTVAGGGGWAGSGARSPDRAGTAPLGCWWVWNGGPWVLRRRSWPVGAAQEGRGLLRDAIDGVVRSERQAARTGRLPARMAGRALRLLAAGPAVSVDATHRAMAGPPWFPAAAVARSIDAAVLGPVLDDLLALRARWPAGLLVSIRMTGADSLELAPTRGRRSATLGLGLGPGSESSDPSAAEGLAAVLGVLDAAGARVVWGGDRRWSRAEPLVGLPGAAAWLERRHRVDPDHRLVVPEVDEPSSPPGGIPVPG